MSCEPAQYLAFAGPPGSADALAQAAAWRDALRDRGWRALGDGPASGAAGRAGAVFEVWGRGRTLAQHRPGLGVLVLGDLHVRGAGRLAFAPDTAPGDAARTLSRRAWGAYVALLRDPGGGAWVFRDPSGGLEALTWQAGALSVAASEVTHLPFGFLPRDLALDWDAITDFVRRPLAVLGRWGLAGFHGVTPGDLQPLGAAADRAVAVWRPAAFAGNAPVDGAETRLRELVDSVAGAALGGTRRAIVEVSGGLDSAIVAAALARAAGRQGAAPPLIALNYYGDRPEGDERAWARAAAAAAGLPLLEAAKTVVPVTEEDFKAFAAAARPALNAVDADRDRHTAALAQAEGADTVFTGKGGDAVFFQAPTPLVVADYRLARGRLPLGDPFVADVARWLRRSVWSVRRAAGRGTGAGGRGGVGAGARAGVWGPRARATPPGPAHRWLLGLEGVAPAKRLQVELVAAAQLASGACRRSAAARLVHPLLAQPVVEHCLSVPAWAHVAGGRDRALARAAFAGHAPEIVLARRSKGALTSLYSRRVAASLPMLRPYLIEGVLAEAGVLDRAALDLWLQPDMLIRRAEGARVLGAAMVEGWVRHWQGRAPDLPGAPRDGIGSRLLF